MKQSHILWTFCLSVLLTSCQAKADYAYLMQHPVALERAFNACQQNTQPTSSDLANCDDVHRAVEHFRALLQEQQSAPEKFGRRIMLVQNKLVGIKQQYDDALLEVSMAQTESIPNLPEKKAELEAVKKQYEDVRFETNVLLAVVSTTAPD